MIIADHKEHMVRNVREADNFTQLYSSWMAPTDAQGQLECLLADLGKGTSWLNMYKMTAKVCERTRLERKLIKAGMRKSPEGSATYDA